MKKLFILMLCMAAAIPAGIPGGAAESAPVAVPRLDVERYEIPDNDAMRFLKAMGVGWNLGNTFDAIRQSQGKLFNEMSLETSWCGVKTSEAMLDALKDAGFTSIRIPVSWHDHVRGKDHQVSERWMARVQEVVDWAYSRGFYVILNIHHDEEQFLPSSEHYEASAHYMECVWQQIAQRFCDYGERLIFESMNEPRLLNSPYEWNFKAVSRTCRDAADCINRLNQLFVDTVRATGGNNAERYLMVPAYAANPDNAVNRYFSLPSDSAENRIIVSAHAYTPYAFALQIKGGTKTFDLNKPAQRNEILRFMNSLYNQYVKNGVPVVIGEYGALNKDNLQDRVDFTAFYVASASARNIPCLWWDNNAYSGDGENFGLLKRIDCTYAYPEILEAIMTYGGYEKLPAAN